MDEAFDRFRRHRAARHHAAVDVGGQRRRFRCARIVQTRHDQRDGLARGYEDGRLFLAVDITGTDAVGDAAQDVGIGDGETDEGVVFVYYGSSTGLKTTASWTAAGDQVSALFGKAIAAGDFNGDGYSDLLVGAPDYTHALTGDGAVFLFKGGLAGLGGRSTTVYGSRTGEHFGAVVASAGDVDGDYDAEVLVGAPSSAAKAGDAATNAANSASAGGFKRPRSSMRPYSRL